MELSRSSFGSERADAHPVHDLNICNFSTTTSQFPIALCGPLPVDVNMAPPKDPPKSPIQYTVIVRLPFPRRDFQDPPQVQWDAAKDKKLWKLIARNPKSASGDLDWAARAAEFGVDTPFLLQQAAWLYERHFKHVKEQMTRIRASSAASTPLSGMAGTSIVGSKKPLAMG